MEGKWGTGEGRERREVLIRADFKQSLSFF
jgi:hypothetical protein